MSQTAPSLFLYYKEYCPFCKIAVKAISRLDLNVQLRETSEVPEYHDELVREGGKRQVPCLKIIKSDSEAQWMYESMDIIEYLQKNEKKFKCEN